MRSRRGRKLIKRPQGGLQRRVLAIESKKMDEDRFPTPMAMQIIGVMNGSACRFGKFSSLTRVDYREGWYTISPVTMDSELIHDLYEHYE